MGNNTFVVVANPDVMHGFSELSTQARSRRWPVFLQHIHADPGGLRAWGWDRPPSALSLCRAIVVLDDSYVEEVTRWHGLATTAIPNPCSIERLQDVPDIRSRKVLTYFGRLAPEKRVDLLVAAFERVAEEFPQWFLSIYGTGECEQELLDQVADSSAVQQIRFHGWSDDPAGAFDASGLHVMVSEHEGFGMSAVEAARRGVPTIGTKASSGLESFLRETGYVVDEDSVEGVATKLREALGDVEGRQCRSVACVKASQRFDISEVTDAWFRLFSDLGK